MAGSEWDEHADGWDDDPGARAYAAAAFGSLGDLVDRLGVDLTGMAVCDFGCGTGLLTERLVHRCGSIDAVDASAAMLAVLDAKIAREQWATVRTMASPTPPASYDLVVCSSVCGFLDDYSGTVASLVELMRPGGLFVQWDWEADPSESEADGLSRAEILETLPAAGLESVAVSIGFSVEFGGQTMAPLMGVGRRPFD